MRWLFVFLIVGCGDPGQLGRSAVAPSNAVTEVALEDVPVNGAEVTVVRNDDTKVTGELLEANDDSVTLLREAQMIHIGAGDVRRAIVTRYDNRTLIAILAVWSAAGAIGQLSHGKFALVTEPIWGAITAGAMLPVAADNGRFAVAEKREELGILREYARFPQGLPAQYRR